MSRFVPELPIIIVWVAIWGIIELLIERYIPNIFAYRLSAHILLLVSVIIAEYIYDFNKNGKLF